MADFQIHPNALRQMSKDEIAALLTRLLSATYTTPNWQHTGPAPGKTLHRPSELNPGNPGTYRLWTQDGREPVLPKVTGATLESQADSGPVRSFNPSQERSRTGGDGGLELV